MLHGVSIVDAAAGRGSACTRFLESLGASLASIAPGARVPDADIVVFGSADDVAEDRPARLIQVFITPFGLSGPYARYRGGELVASAMGGVLNGCGYGDRSPVKEAGDACWFHANAMAAAGALFALHEREASGLGQIVDVSAQEVAASRTTNAMLAWQFDKRRIKRAGPALNYGRAAVRCVWDLADGYVFHTLMTGRFGAPANQALSDWMDERGAENPLHGVDWLAYDRSALPADTRAVWEAAIAAFFRTLTKADIAGEGLRRGINATPANEPIDILRDPHLLARGFLTETRVAGRTVRKLGRFVRVVEPASAPVKSKRGAASPDAAPLAGVRVLDFSWALVGSFTTKTLGDFGADVIKVETSTRPCLSRIDVQVSASKRGEFDDKPWFAHMNTSKRSLRLNLKHKRAREVIDPLIDWADVIVENFSPGTMASLGLDYETLSRRRPDLVMVSGSVYGQTGPMAREWGVDGTGAALSGRLALTGWPDRAPVPPLVPYGDVVMPPLMAGAAIAALFARARSGLGRHIDASMYEICAQQMADAIMAAQIGETPRRSGNRDRHVVLQGVFPVAGEDRWIAITLPSAADWGAFTRHIGGDWPAEPNEACEARIAAWTAPQDGHTLMTSLQATGIAAGMVQDASETVDEDPQLRARGFLTPLEHALLGAFAHQSTPITFSRSQRRMRSAPRLGEHTEAICREVIGLSQDEIAELRAADLFV
ncbi:MAG: CoA transferase [Hyphomonadaceae bacterium]|nr:CoA transferase [Hyphomonadaceae bacterium]